MRLQMTFDTLDEFLLWGKSDTTAATRRAVEVGILDSWAATGEERFLVDGFCVVCDMPSQFSITRRRQGDSFVEGPPNWRERLKCQQCRLINRIRAAYALIRELVPDPEAHVWIAEQTTSLYRRLTDVYPNLIGSEFCGDEFPSGVVTDRGIRHEDVTCSSFADGSLDAVLSFDVLEHVPGYQSALEDTRRTLKPGGVFIWSAPFLVHDEHTQIRARLLADGSIEHLHPPIYHGDPMKSADGILCFQHFGWDIVADMKSAGFREAAVVMMWSDELVNVGPLLPMFVGRA